MVRLEELEALDLLLWLQNGTTAASVAGTNQSTISRRTQRVLSTFQGRLLRQKSGWRLKTPLLPLLDLQRQIHQQVRLRQGHALRFNVPAWSRPLLSGCPLRGWLLNPEQGPLVCEQPLELLRSHVIDACLLTPTQLAGQNLNDLEIIDLYNTRIDLHLLADSGDDSRHDSSAAAAWDVLMRSRLELLPFLPASCRASSLHHFEALQSGLAASSGPRPDVSVPAVAFLTPVMALSLEQQRPLSLELEWPYRESLAVLRCNAGQPPLMQLAEQLSSGVPRALAALVPQAR